MKIGLLFFADAYLSEDRTQSLMGRFVANDQFLQALNEAGHEIYLYVSTKMEADYLNERLLGRFENAEIVTFAQLYLEPTRFEPDVLHIQSPNMYRCFHLRHQIFKKPIPVTGVTHSLGHQPFLEWVLLNHLHGVLPCDALVCTTPTARAAVENFHERILSYLPDSQKLKTKVIPLGVFPAPEPALSRTQARQKFGMSPDDVSLSWVGRFSYATKADLGPVLLMLRDLKANPLKKRVRFYCAGSLSASPDMDLFKEMIEDYGIQEEITLLPEISPQDKEALLAASDVFLAPSDNIQETFGLSVLEALNAGLPVIAADWDGFRSLVDASCGFLIPTWNLYGEHPSHELSALQLDSVNHFWFSQSVVISQADLLKAIRCLVEDDSLRARLGEGAKKRARLFHWGEVMSRYEELWTELKHRCAALNLPPKGPTLRYQEDFLPYWTGQLSLTQKIVLSERGADLLQGKMAARFYPEMEEWVIASLLKDMMMGALKPLALGDLLALFKEDRGLLHLHALWLLKNGFLAVEG